MRHRRCDSRCVNAQPGSPCSCQCGGRNHAGAWSPDPTTGQPRTPPPGRWTTTRHEPEHDPNQLTLI
jgi:hypothetical protein